MLMCVAQIYHKKRVQKDEIFFGGISYVWRVLKFVYMFQ